MENRQNPIDLVKQGDPVAIAQLINRALQPKGITARVTRTGTSLKVMLEADQIPDQRAIVPYLQKNLEKLGILSIKTIELYGKQACAATPAWRQSISVANQIMPASQPSPPPAPPVVTEEPRVQPTATNPVSAAMADRIRAMSPVGKSQRLYQAMFSGVIALVLILIGANLRSLHRLIAKPKQSAQQVELAKKPKGVYQAQIINRIGGVPVIMVTFNGNHTTPMIVDTGASGTVVTQTIAARLGIVPIGQSIAQTANGYTTFDVGYVDSIEVEGAKINRVPVAIGLADMNIGLLGHDFFGNFDVTVRETTVEFRPRSGNADQE
ncbi:retroviral-like aspartic protease family protein [Leptothermofonsia sichuanensis E412]|uniref:retropepsin-like aspartic protease family protein n=1 Tax=Leptothermofonsia sichuanensis TaxID=2917832 RepID=UPI001CA6F59F|nr:retropepsin-like aspartic protease [Leptothermofonsia sichuanensis]QZZ21182.1 retroviral-like aspartic protease family protein [Leptothermofonsia sichuanensis E412]